MCEYVSVCVCVCVRECVSVCVCEREREVKGSPGQHRVAMNEAAERKLFK